jgi:hypothetical protein
MSVQLAALAPDQALERCLVAGASGGQQLELWQVSSCHS